MVLFFFVVLDCKGLSLVYFIQLSYNYTNMENTELVFFFWIDFFFGWPPDECCHEMSL